MDQQDTKYLTTAMLAKRWSVSVMFIERRMRDEAAKAAGFPQPVRLVGAERKRLFPIDAVELYERQSAGRPAPGLKPLRRRAASGARS
jgi:hypothetical protein